MAKNNKKSGIEEVEPEVKPVEETAAKASEEVKNIDDIKSIVDDEAKPEENKTPTKSVVVRCIAAVICAAILGTTVSSSIEKYADAIKPAEDSEAGEAGDTAQDDFFADFDTPVDEGGAAAGADTQAPADSGAAAGDAAAEETPAGDDAAASEDAGASDSSASGGAAESTTAAQNKPASAASMSKAQVITLFNNAANGAKSNAKSIKQNYTKNTQVSSIELKNKALASLADKLIAANMGEDMAKHDKTYTGADKAGYFPVAGQSWASKLTEADVKSAVIKENKNGDTYAVVINLVDDTQKNLKAGEGHAGKAFSLVTKEQIVEGAGSAGMAFIDESSIKVGHSGCVIKATIDKATGNLKTANYYRVWKLELTAVGIDVGISFGIEEDYVINW